MTMEELKADIAKGEAELIADEAQVKTLRASMLAKHDALEMKRRAIPIVPTANDLVLDPMAVGSEEAMLKWIAQQPKKFLDFLKKNLGDK